jgi:hypothetical protein
MKYMLLIYQNSANWENLPQADRDVIMEEANRIVNELTESGELVGGEGLAHSSQTKTIKVRGGVRTVTDGPFLEAKEQLAGYCLLECDSVDRAVEIAADWPDARYWAVEIRALMSGSGSEM